jgi:multidrug efflux pump subunit AcrB
VVGGLLLLFLTGNTLSFTSIVGFIALLGIEVKTSILLVDFTLRAQPTNCASVEQCFTASAATSSEWNSQSIFAPDT